MKGINFTPEMIRAIVEGRKTVTRRLYGLKEINQNPDGWEVSKWDGEYTRTAKGAFQFIMKPLLAVKENLKAIKPRYQAGEVVYIKETYSHYGNTGNCGLWVANVKYKLDEEIKNIPFNDHRPPSEKWWNTGKPIGYYQTPLFMPAWAARYFIQITDVRPELFRITQMTADEIALEGGEQALAVLKEHNGKWLWVYEFKKVDKPAER